MQFGPVTLTPAARALHAEGLGAVREFAAAQARLLAVLGRVDESRLFEDFNCTSLFSYAVKHLGLGEIESAGTIAVTRASAEVPELRAAVGAGLPMSRAARISPVITPLNKDEWLERARSWPKSRLDRAVADACPRAPRRECLRPSSDGRFDFAVNVSASLADQIRRAQEIVSQKERHAATLETTLTVMTEFYLYKKDPVARAYRAASRANASARSIVLARDHGACQMRDEHGTVCGSKRFVDVHHIVPRAAGGTDDPSNLITLCSACHRLWHRKHGHGPPPDSG